MSASFEASRPIFGRIPPTEVATADSAPTSPPSGASRAVTFGAMNSSAPPNAAENAVASTFAPTNAFAMDATAPATFCFSASRIGETAAWAEATAETTWSNVGTSAENAANSASTFDRTASATGETRPASASNPSRMPPSAEQTAG